jgi:glucose-6-phosphate 1-epimerase
MNASNASPNFSIASGAGGLPKLSLSTGDGSCVEVYLHGATVVSWRPAGDTERLFVSRAARFGPGEAIRGGVPVVFPQFGALGPLRQHGFARRLAWEFVGVKSEGEWLAAVLRLQDSAETQRDWPHRFLAELRVALGGRTLAITLGVTNTDDRPFGFTAALHTYLAVANPAETHLEGLAGLHYRDHAAGGSEAQQVADWVDFPGEVDRLYFGAPTELRFVEGGRTTVIRSAGFPDAVVWNPGAVKAASMADLEVSEHWRFVCVEAAVAGAPVALAPGERWQGTQTLVA